MVQQINQELGKKLKEFRIRKFDKVGLRRVAEDIGIDYSYLYRIEEGIYKPSDETLSKLANTYTLSPRETLDVFNLAHIGSAFKKVIENVKKDDLWNSFSYYRKSKKK